MIQSIRRAYLIADILTDVLGNMKEPYYLCNYSKEEILETIRGLREYILCCEGNGDYATMESEHPLTHDECFPSSESPEQQQ